MSAHLWTMDALIAAMGGRAVGDVPKGVTGITIDSRSAGKGEAFFAIKGDTFDGHDFITAAMVSGAAVCVVAESKIPALGKLTAPLIVVDDVLAALERLALASRARTRAKIIAVTGSAGKTTTKEALRHCLSAVGKVHASAASFNNHWGVPLTMAKMPEDTQYGVFEVGMNHPGEIRNLIRFVQPHVAIITIIAAAHLGFFKNLDEIADAKAEIFEGIVHGGAAILNRDDQRYRLLEHAAKKAGVENIIGFGENVRAKFRLVKCELHAENSSIIVRIGGKDMFVKVGAPGRHIVQNALAVLGAAQIVGADLEKMASAMASLTAEKGRGQRHVLGIGTSAFTLIDESYNANPASMRAALALLRESAPSGKGRRIAVLGDMLELGRHSKRLHADLAEPIRNAKADKVFLAGAEMKALAETLPVEFHAEYRQSAAELSRDLAAFVRAGDVVMVKSSNGIGFAKLVEHLITQFKPFKPAEAAA
jgi:UDP-N-acetylmuramoyl-tripeptide--D-alanyl-D-alanine ligase